MLKCECASDILVSHALDVTPEKLFGVLIDKGCWLPSCPLVIIKRFPDKSQVVSVFYNPYC